ncbi:hypothetical protein ANO11243_067930 [Dothideomycetidae sp. 11243]|nr:hypothetical protein ANO11243_067930 [fungal sp. No.11243]
MIYSSLVFVQYDPKHPDRSKNQKAAKACGVARARRRKCVCLSGSESPYAVHGLKPGCACGRKKSTRNCSAIPGARKQLLGITTPLAHQDPAAGRLEGRDPPLHVRVDAPYISIQAAHSLHPAPVEQYAVWPADMSLYDSIALPQRDMFTPGGSDDESDGTAALPDGLDAPAASIQHTYDGFVSSPGSEDPPRAWWIALCDSLGLPYPTLSSSNTFGLDDHSGIQYQCFNDSNGMTMADPMLGLPAIPHAIDTGFASIRRFVHQV